MREADRPSAGRLRFRRLVRPRSSIWSNVRSPRGAERTRHWSAGALDRTAHEPLRALTLGPREGQHGGVRGVVASWLCLPMPLPLVFIGSSTEGESYAQGAKAVLEETRQIRARHWRDVMAKAHTQTVIEAVMDALDDYDFGVFILSKDDVLTIRGEETKAARDNVILELGLFTGRLTRKRTFIIGPDDFDIRFATDLLGTIIGTYNNDPDHRSAIRTAAGEARGKIVEIGPREPDSVAPTTPNQVSGGRGAISSRHTAMPPDGWIEAAREGQLLPLAGVRIEPGMWVASVQTGLAQVVEVLPPVRGAMLVSVEVEGLEQPLYLDEDRLFLPKFRPATDEH